MKAVIGAALGETQACLSAMQAQTSQTAKAGSRKQAVGDQVRLPETEVENDKGFHTQTYRQRHSSWDS